MQLHTFLNHTSMQNILKGEGVTRKTHSVTHANVSQSLKLRNFFHVHILTDLVFYYYYFSEKYSPQYFCDALKSVKSILAYNSSKKMSSLVRFVKKLQKMSEL